VFAEFEAMAGSSVTGKVKVCVAPSNDSLLEATEAFSRLFGIVAAKVTRHSAGVVLTVLGIIVHSVGIVIYGWVRVVVTSSTASYVTKIYGLSQGSRIVSMTVRATSVIALPARDYGVITMLCTPAMEVSTDFGT